MKQVIIALLIVKWTGIAFMFYVLWKTDAFDE